MDLNPDGQFVGLVIIHSITAFGASKGYKMISSLIKTYQDLFPPPSDRDTISLLSCSGEKMCLKRRICEIFYEKYDENFTKNHNHDAYWKGRGRTVQSKNCRLLFNPLAAAQQKPSVKRTLFMLISAL